MLLCGFRIENAAISFGHDVCSVTPPHTHLSCSKVVVVVTIRTPRTTVFVQTHRNFSLFINCNFLFFFGNEINLNENFRTYGMYA